MGWTLGGMVAAGSADALAGKPGGGSAPPPDPAIACLQQGKSTTDRDLVVMNADGTNRRVVLDGGSSHLSAPDWSPDGTQLVFKGDLQGKGLYVINVDGTGLRKVVALEGAADPDCNSVPRWSPVPAPDGHWKLAYADTHTGGSSAALWVVDLDGTGRSQLTQTPALPSPYEGVQEISWAPGADRIAVGVYDYPGYGRSDILVHDLGTPAGTLAITGTLNVTDDGDVAGGSLNARRVTSPCWSRTGNRLAVDVQPVAGSGEQYTVWVIDLASPGTATRASASTGTEQVNPCWSPDDTRFVVSQWHNARCLFTMNADGTSLAEIAHGSRSLAFFTPSWRR